MKYFMLMIACLLSFSGWCQQLRFSDTGLPEQASIRGLSVVDDRDAWLGANSGWVASTADGGRTWKASQVAGFHSSDFRSVYAFSASEVVIANAGSPAHILRTEDGGKSWNEVYVNPHADAFIDGIDFWDKNNGVAYGDPINGRMLLLFTSDGGRTWQERADAPRLNPGEASFAASGTGIRCVNRQSLLIATGGSTFRVVYSSDRGRTFELLSTPIIQGQQGTGIFSLCLSGKTLIIAGGDFQNPAMAENHIFYSEDSGHTWQKPISPTGGYRECVEVIAAGQLLAVGPEGIDLSTDNGRKWRLLSTEKGFHVARVARKGNVVILGGSKGRVALFLRDNQKN